MLPMLAMQLDTMNIATSDLKKLEDTSRIFCEVQTSFFNFYGPREDRKKFGAQFDKLAEQGLYNQLVDHVRLHSQSNKREQVEAEPDMQIDSIPASQNSTVSR